MNLLVLEELLLLWAIARPLICLVLLLLLMFSLEAIWFEFLSFPFSLVGDLVSYSVNLLMLLETPKSMTNSILSFESFRFILYIKSAYRYSLFNSFRLITGRRYRPSFFLTNKISSETEALDFSLLKLNPYLAFLWYFGLSNLFFLVTLLALLEISIVLAAQ